MTRSIRCRWRETAVLLGGVAVAVGLFVLSRTQFVLFHTLVELVSILIAIGIFVLAWNTREIHTNGFLLLLGVAYLSVGGIDLLHTLSYEGMDLFAGYGINLPTQLWIAARAIESLTLLAASRFMRRTIRPSLVVGIYAIVTGALLALIFLRWFPDSYVEGTGLTLFKRLAEYAISVVLVGALWSLYRHRQKLEQDVFRWLSASIVFTIGSEIAFTLYVDVFGTANVVGHILKLFSFYFIYRAIIQTGLTRPLALLFNDLTEKEKSIQEANAQLAERVEERTSELLAANEHLGVEVSERTQIEAALRASKRDLQALTRRLVMAQEEERLRLSRELHDDAGQALTALCVSLDLVAADAKDSKERARIEQASRLAEETLERLRDLAHGLRPAALDALGIEHAASELVQDFSRQTGLVVEFDGSPAPDLPDEIAVSVYRVLQEALTNVARHARASQVWVLLKHEPAQLCLTVRDNGLGFETETLEAGNGDSSGQGLIGIRERIEQVGGRLELTSSPGQGTTLQAFFDLGGSP